MEESKRTVAFIPVRGGSKSIPKKNIKPIAGRPLVWWTMDAALECGVFDDIIISTDDDEISSVVMNHPKSDRITLFRRSTETATDSATTESAMLEYAHTSKFETIVLLQATSPLTSGKDIESAMARFRSDPECSGVLSVCRQERFTWSENSEGYYSPDNYTVGNRPRRQEFSGYLVENGAIYITSREYLVRTGNRISANILCSEMPAYTYYELDEPSDWPVIETMLRKYKGVRHHINSKKIKLFISDVDGVLTDAGMYYSEKGDELKKFNTRDGKGFEMLQKNGVTVGIITGEDTRIVADRANKLNIDLLHQGIKEKGKLVTTIMQDLKMAPDNVAYIGDDVNDLSIMNIAGFTACPADAMEQVKKSVDYVCLKKGGEGCVREVAELMVSAAD